MVTFSLSDSFDSADTSSSGTNNNNNSNSNTIKITNTSSSRRTGDEDENPFPTGMLLEFQQLKGRIITTTTTCHSTTTQLRNVPSIIDSIGCDITIEDIESAQRELINNGVDLKMDVNQIQNLPTHPQHNWEVTPMIHFCWTGNLRIVKVLCLIGANCTQLCKLGYHFPMLSAAQHGHLDICKWLFEYGGDAKDHINKEAKGSGFTPLSISCVNEGQNETGRWLLRNGGGQHLSAHAICLFGLETNSNHLVVWMRENIQLHDTFILFLWGATTITTSSSSSLSEPSDGGTRKCKRQRKIHPEPKRSLQILDGHPGIMELIGEYTGFIRGKEFRMLQEFNELDIEYITTNYRDATASVGTNIFRLDVDDY